VQLVRACTPTLNKNGGKLLHARVAKVNASSFNEALLNEIFKMDFFFNKIVEF
jgi:hypothetical protein